MSRKVRCYVPHGVTASRIWGEVFIDAGTDGYVDVTEPDADQLLGLGWTRLPNAYVGVATDKPTGPNLKVGLVYIDTTNSVVLVYNGTAWVNAVTAAEV